MDNEFDKKYNIVDEVTPPNVPLSAHYKKSFAYYTVVGRLPVILTNIVDSLSKDKDEIVQEFGEEAREAVKVAVGEISKLKYEMQTDKVLGLFNGEDTDRPEWNTFIKSLPDESNSYLKTTWLYAECYMYRKLKSIFEESVVLRDYDYFKKLKMNGLLNSIPAIEAVAIHLTQYLKEEESSRELLKDLFKRYMKLTLWGNRSDLSISAGREIKNADNPLDLIDSFDKFILVDRLDDIWDCIQSAKNGQPVVIDFINDNAGYEIFTDFALAAMLLKTNLASKITFHLKAIPWFISDCLKTDFNATVNFLLGDDKSAVIQELGRMLKQLNESGQLDIAPIDYFWTQPYEYYTMERLRPDLYKSLGQSDLLIFKGDLNYRKLLADFNWPFSSSFTKVLNGFHPTNLCALRTIKADLVAEIPDPISMELSEKDPMWMETGLYGLIQFAKKP